MFARYGGMSIFVFLETRGILPYVRAKMLRAIGVFTYKINNSLLVYFVNTSTAKCDGRTKKKIRKKKRQSMSMDS
jgi:hypothetical protein